MYEYIVGYFIVTIMALIIEITAVCHSARINVNTDITNTRLLEQIVFSRLILALVEVIFVLTGLVYLVKFRNQCLESLYDRTMRYILFGTVTVSSTLVTVILVFIISAFESTAECLYDRGAFKGWKEHSLQILPNKQRLTACKENIKHRLLVLPLHQINHRQAFENICENLEFLFKKYSISTSHTLTGLLLLRKAQKLHMRAETIKKCNKDGVYDYLSGVPITVETKFFNLNSKNNFMLYKDLIYFFEYAAASYGNPVESSLSCPCFKRISGLKYQFLIK